MSKSFRWTQLGWLLAAWRCSSTPLTSSESLKTHQFFNIFIYWASLAASGDLQELILSPLEPPDAHLEPFGASRSSFGALWSLQNAIMEPIFTIPELPGASKS